MKILVMYFSQSGNTEKIAQGIYEEVAQTNEADLKKLEDVSVEDFAGYDFVFIGSPLHSASLAPPVKDCLQAVKGGSNQKLACFITHFAPAYPKQDMDHFAEPVEIICKDKKFEYKGCFDCQGALAPSMHGPVQQKLALSDEGWKEMAQQMAGHPDDQDVANAKAFARKAIG